MFNIHPNIAEAHTLHTDFYTDPVHYHASRERLFAPCWHYVGHTGLVPEKGSIYPFTLLENFLDEPLLLTRDQHDQIHCLSNVCTHRGNLVAQQACKSSQLRCRYHGRVFGLNGHLLHAPGFQGVANFPMEPDNLHALPLLQWGQLLFVNLSKKESLNAPHGLEEMMNRMAWFPMDQLVYRDDLSKSFQVNAHWALYCENYLEGFHIPFVHPSLNQVIDFGNYTTELFSRSNLQLGLAKKGEDVFDLPPDSPDFGKPVAAYYFWLFPNMMFNFYPWGLSFNLVEPQGIASSKVSFYTFVLDESKLEKGAGAGLGQVEMEDEEVVESVQQGVRSRFYQQGRFSATLEQGPHHFQSIVAKMLKQE